MVIGEATIDDAEELLALQKLSYLSEAEIYDDYSIQPLTESLDNLREEFSRRIVLKVTHEGRIIGSVRAHLEGGTCHIGKLMVHPDHRNRGVGKMLMGEVEGKFENAARFELFTGHKSEKNISLYMKLSYKISKMKKISDKLTLLYFEKQRYTTGMIEL